MSAAPFGGHPTLGRYIEWARTKGCTVRNGVMLDDDGRPHSITQIFAPDKKRWITEIGTLYTERIVPTTIARFDRRLGLSSPFFSIDAPEMDEE